MEANNIIQTSNQQEYLPPRESLTKQDLLQLQSLVERCLEAAGGAYSRYLFQTTIRRVAQEAKTLLSRRAVNDEIDPATFSSDDVTLLRECYKKLAQIEAVMFLHKEVSKGDFTEEVEADIRLGTSDDHFLEEHGLTYGPRAKGFLTKRALLFDENLNFIYPTPAEWLRSCYFTQYCVRVVEPMENVLRMELDEGEGFSFLYYSTSGSGEFYELKEDIAQHNLYKDLYREEDHIEPKESIQDILERKIKKRIGKEVKVVYDPLKRTFYPDRSYVDPITKIEMTEETPIDSEDFGYVNYQPLKHGSPGHFFMRYVPRGWFLSVFAYEGIEKGISLRPSYAVKLSPNGQINYSCCRTDGEGYTIWERIIERMHHLSLPAFSIPNRLFRMIKRVFSDSFDCDYFPNEIGEPVSPTWRIHRKFHPFFIKNDKTKDNFFHMAFRELSAPTHSVSNIIKCLSEGFCSSVEDGLPLSLEWYALGYYENSIFAQCREFVYCPRTRFDLSRISDAKTNSKAQPLNRSLLEAFLSLRALMLKLNTLHGLFTERNAKGETPMDILVEKNLTCQNHEEKDFSFELPRMLNKILDSIVTCYQITNYDNLLYRFCYYSEPWAIKDGNEPIRRVFDEEVDLPFPFWETENSYLFRAAVLGLPCQDYAALSPDDLHEAAVTYMENKRAFYAPKIQAQIKALLEENRPFLKDPDKLFCGLPEAFKNKLIAVLEENPEKAVSYADSEEGLNDYLEHLLNLEAWDDKINLVLLARLFDVEFRLYNDVTSFKPYRRVGEKNCPSIHLLYRENQYVLRVSREQDGEDFDGLTMYMPERLTNTEKDEAEIAERYEKEYATILEMEQKILQEIAKDMGDPECSKNESEEPLPFVDIDVPADGSCLFHAIALSLQLNVSAELTSQDLRNIVFSYIKHNIEMHSTSIQAQITDLFTQSHEDENTLFRGIAKPFKTKLKEARKKGPEAEQAYATSEEGVNDYLDAMLNPISWVGVIELGVIAKLLQRELLIYDDPSATDPSRRIGEATHPKMHLLYTGDHYKVRIPRVSSYIPQTFNPEATSESSEKEVISEQALAIIEPRNLKTVNQKIRFLLRQRLYEMIEGLFAKREEKPSIYETFLQSHLCRYYRNARYEDPRSKKVGGQTEAEMANSLRLIFYNSHLLPVARRFWLSKTFGSDPRTQCNRLKDFIISLVYHERRDEGSRGKVSSVMNAESNVDLSSVRKGIGNVGYFFQTFWIQNQIGEAERAIEQVFRESGNDIEIAVRTLLDRIADAEDVSLFFKKKTDKETSTLLTTIWSTIFQMVMCVIFVIFPQKPQSVGEK